MIINPILPIWVMVGIVCLLMALKRKGIVSNLRKLGILGLLFVINLRIMVPDDAVRTGTINREVSILFVVDNTISMLAVDSREGRERLEVVKEDCAYIMEKLYGAQCMAMYFDNTANRLTPFSRDTNFTQTAIDSINPMDPLYAKGSSISVCKELMLDVLKQKKKTDDEKVVVFFFSDGENNTESKMGSFEEIREYVDGGAVLGYGTEKGGKMYVRKIFSEDEKEVLQDETDYPYVDAISKIDEKNLKQIAEEMGISYIRMDKQENINGILGELQKIGTELSEEDETHQGYKDIYYWFVLPLILLLLIEFRICVQEKVK